MINFLSLSIAFLGCVATEAVDSCDHDSVCLLQGGAFMEKSQDLHHFSNVQGSTDTTIRKTGSQRHNTTQHMSTKGRLDICMQQLSKCDCDTTGLAKDFGISGSRGSGADDDNLLIAQAGVAVSGLHLLEQTSGIHALNVVRTAKFAEGASDADVADLKSLFDSHGSDKGSARHNYAPIYANVLGELGRDSPLSIFEVGMGTQDPAISSHMGDGEGFQPGSSLRAWRDYLPHSEVFGADYDSKIMMTEDRIQTHVIDQLDYHQYENLWSDFGQRQFDLIIDDAIHSNIGNLNTIAFGLNGACKPNGWIVLEDIPHGRVGFFSIVKTMLQPRNIEVVTIAVRNEFPIDDEKQVYVVGVKCP